MKTEKVYLNGKFVSVEKAAVSVFDRGLNYGDGIFETMKSLNGKVFYLKDHLIRLKTGSKAIGIPPAAIRGVEKDLKNGMLENLLGINGLSKGYAYIKVMVTRGTDRGGHLPAKKPTPTVIAVCKSLDVRAVSNHSENGVRVTLARGYRRCLPGIKTLNFLPNILGKRLAEKRNAFEAIFVDGDSNLTEGTSTNLFMIESGGIKTPPAGKNSSEGVLPGIMRKNVLKFAGKKGINVVEAPIHITEIHSCEEAFLTNSILGVIPIIRFDSEPVGSGKPGDMTRLIQRAICREIRKYEQAHYVL